MTLSIKSVGKKGRYRLLAGKHTDLRAGQTPIMYRPGDIIDTEDDLTQFNPPGMPAKFERIDSDHPLHSATTWNPDAETLEDFTDRMRRERTNLLQENQAAPGGDDLSTSLRSMTVDQLHQIAADEEIELPSGLNDRDKLVAHILKGVNR